LFQSVLRFAVLPDRWLPTWELASAHQVSIRFKVRGASRRVDRKKIRQGEECVSIRFKVRGASRLHRLLSRKGGAGVSIRFKVRGASRLGKYALAIWFAEAVSIRFKVRGASRRYQLFHARARREFQSALRFAVLPDTSRL